MRFIGVDGCPGGWVSVSLSARGSWAVVLDADFRAVFERWREADHILVDIPIGLRDSGAERACDLAARQVLTGRTSSVFPAPLRRSIDASSYEEASQLNREGSGRGLSKQSWSITGKIREVDEVLQEDALARRIIREVHPELLFWGLTGAAMADNKRKAAGREARLAALEPHFPEAREVVDHAARVFRPKLIAEDDVIDAMVAAVVARLGRFRTLPEQPERDSVGLPMEMVYAHGD